MVITNEFSNHIVYTEVHTLALSIRLGMVSGSFEMGNPQFLVESLYHVAHEFSSSVSQYG